MACFVSCQFHFSGFTLFMSSCKLSRLSSTDGCLLTVGASKHDNINTATSNNDDNNNDSSAHVRILSRTVGWIANQKSSKWPRF